MGVVRVIISKDMVYTTDHNTIRFEAKLTRKVYGKDWYLTEDSWDVIDKAKSVAWDYASGMNFNIDLRTLEVHTEEWSSDKVFEYLDKLEKRETY